MRREEDQPQPLIEHHGRCLVLDPSDRRWPVVGHGAGHGIVSVALRVPHQQRKLALERLGAPDRVERAAPGRRGQPAGPILRDAFAGPGPQRLDAGLLDAVLGEVQVAGERDRRREHRAPVVTVRGGDGRSDVIGDVRAQGVGHAGTLPCTPASPTVIGRTSTPPPWWMIGLRRATAIAASRSGTSIT